MATFCRTGVAVPLAALDGFSGAALVLACGSVLAQACSAAYGLARIAPLLCPDSRHIHGK